MKFKLDENLGSTKMNAPAILGRKGGTAAARKLGPDHYRKMALARKTRGRSRPRKDTTG